MSSSSRARQPKRSAATVSNSSSPAVRTEPNVTALARLGIPNAGEIMRLKARSRTEAEMIETALQDAPPLDREEMGAELFPFNEIASAASVQAVIEKITRRRNPDSPWNAAHKALLLTDENGKGYADFIDTFRDVTFLVGVDYALRSLPSWWTTFQGLNPVAKALFGRMAVDLDDSIAKGGER